MITKNGKMCDSGESKTQDTIVFYTDAIHYKEKEQKVFELKNTAQHTL